MLRWGILGVGGLASGRLAPALRATGHDLAVAGSRSLVRAQAFAANHGVRRARGSYDEVLAAPDVDAVLISLPTGEHVTWAIAALDAGKHVLCARPLAPDAEGATAMAAAAARSGRVLLEAVAPRYHPRTQALLELLRSGAVGAVRLVTITIAEPLTAAESYRTTPDTAGGALLDLGVDAIAMSRWLVGEEPEVVRAVQRRWATGVDGTTTAVLAFPGGATAALTASYDAVAHDTIEVVGTDATLRVPRAFSAGAETDAVVLRGPAGADGPVSAAGEELVGTWRADPWEHLIDAFEAAAGGRPPLADVDDAVATAHVLDWIRGG